MPDTTTPPVDVLTDALIDTALDLLDAGGSDAFGRAHEQMTAAVIARWAYTPGPADARLHVPQAPTGPTIATGGGR